MSKLTMSIVAATAVAFGAAGVAAQQTPAPAKKVMIPAKTFYKGQEATQYLVRDRLIGAKVYNKDGQSIGDIEDVIVGSDNKVEGVIMGVGGFLGVGEKKIGVRYSALKYETKDGKTTVTLPQATKDVLAALEPYKRAEPKRTMVERATETAKDLAEKAKEATKKAGEAARGAYDKATGGGQQPAEKKQ